MFDVHEMEVNFGPQHPSTHGVLRVLLKIDGERIIDAKPIIGYLHRGTEKLFENMAYPQCIPHTDRMDYVAAATNNLGFVETVEKLLGVTKLIPRRAQLMRVMLSRAAAHLLAPALARHARHRHRRDDAVLLLPSASASRSSISSRATAARG